MEKAMENEIINMLIAILPSATSIFGIIGAVYGFTKKVKNLKQDIDDKTDCRDLQKTIGKVVDENQQLKKEIEILKTQIDHVHRG